MAQFNGHQINNPKFSIITPSFNQGKFIEETILSVIKQDYSNWEYIIIDGGSTDETLNIIKKYEQHLKYWVSEKDMGQADAINKGLTHCSGEIFNFINSDDYLEPGALQKIAKAFNNVEVGAVAGLVENFSNAGDRKIIRNQKIDLKEFFIIDPNYVYHQPGVWLRTDVAKKAGTYRTDYHYCFDQEFMLRYLQVNNKITYIPELLAHFRVHETSKSVAQAQNFFYDFNRMYREFWKSNSGPMSVLAREKHKKFEWPLLQEKVGKESHGRLNQFFHALWLIVRDPIYRVNKKNLGWLKHIVLRK